ncbi:MAG: phospholipase D-like domain-containing protein [Gemmatimonas sp.]
MSNWIGFGADVPWWAWTLLTVGIIALIGVIGALFLPDWPSGDYESGFDADPGSEKFVEWTGAFLNVPIYQGGTVELLQNGDKFYPSMLEAIRGAKDSVNFEVYIFEPDEIGRQFMDAFIERARAGVETRVLLDGFGAIKMKKRHRDELRAAGVRLTRFRPFSFKSLVRFYKRTHRRAIVIDGTVAYTGGAAVSVKWKGNVSNDHEWRDSMTRVTGQLVGGIQSAFASNWVYCTGEVLAGERFFPKVASSAGPCSLSVVSSPSDAAQPIRLLFWLSFINARHRLWICSSYFIPDARLRKAVMDRAKAGVDVRVLVPGNHTDAVPVQAAGRGYYEVLLTAGVRIFEYQPAMMHAKSVVVDGAWSVVGSANLDERSMELNEENIVGIGDKEFAAAIEKGLAEDMSRANEVHLEEWKKRPWRKRVFEEICTGLIEQY